MWANIWFPSQFSDWKPCKSTSIFFQGSSCSKSSLFSQYERNSNELHISLSWGIGQNNLWKEIFISTEKNKRNFCQVRYFKWRRFLSSTLFFFTINWTQTASFVTALIPPSSLNGISCRFEFHNLWRAWDCQHWLFII